MLRSLKELLGYNLVATDGDIGKVHNFFFSDEDWKIRYLVVDTGPWIFGRKVLISPYALQQPVWTSETFPVNLTREGVKASPDIDLAKPVSREYEEELLKHYNWPAYWSITSSQAGQPFFTPPYLFVAQEDNTKEKLQSHLRSATELIDYQVFATDGEVGNVTDFILEDEDWQIRYMIVDTNGNLETGKKVMVALEWISRIEVGSQEIQIDLTQDAIKHSPSFDSTLPVNRQYEEVLYDYHGRPKYWQAVEKDK
ncbi:MAG: PRC-barrel domain-containing protein [Anaerolineales bacterium]|nr:PRC-barrel domain-containing protein [Anaerolineales bacterium]